MKHLIFTLLLMVPIGLTVIAQEEEKEGSGGDGCPRTFIVGNGGKNTSNCIFGCVDPNSDSGIQVVDYSILSYLWDGNGPGPNAANFQISATDANANGIILTDANESDYIITSVDFLPNGLWYSPNGTAEFSFSIADDIPRPITVCFTYQTYSGDPDCDPVFCYVIPDCGSPCPGSSRLSVDHKGSSIQLFPNPVQNVLNVELEVTTENHSNVEISIYSSTGQNIFNKLVSSSIKLHSIPVENLPKSTYFVSATYGEHILYKMFIKGN